MALLVFTYRRDDTLKGAGRIYDRFINHFGRAQLFRDIEDFEAGVSFKSQVEKNIKKAEVLLALIGPKWFGVLENGARRLDDENDPVRVEIEFAYQCQKPIIPVLIDGAHMPSPEELPLEIRDFAYLNAVQIDEDFDRSIERLIRAIEVHLSAHARAAIQAFQASRAKDESPPPKRSPQSAVIEDNKEVFVSYCNEDEEVAVEIVGLLEEDGLSCWIANRDVWDNYQEEIVKAIERAKVMVIVFSDNANRSDEIKKELSLAGRRKLRKIPIRINDAEPTGAFAYELATAQYIDFFRNREMATSRMLQAVRRAVAMASER